MDIAALKLMAEQLLLDLPLRAALGREDFLVAPSNEAAVRLVDEWPNWPTHGAILVGPAGCGKSHLVRVWQSRSHAEVATGTTTTTEALPDLFANKALCLEDIDVGQFDETMMFHALNLARQERGHVLLTSRLEPALWQVKLADLASRLKALPVVHILPPDDALLRAVLVKQFVDRQIVVDEALIGYMILRMPRSAAAARALVAEIDRQAMVEKAEITRPFVAKVMARVESPDLFTT